MRAKHPVRWTILLMAALALAVHVVANALGGYGYFRDELYYIACSKHLAAGYVDQPPLSILVLAGTERLFGDSIFAIRLVPAILSGVSAALVGLLARRLGGGRTAVVMASLAFIAAPQIMGFHAYYSMNSLDIMFWLLAVHALLGAAERGTLRHWLLLGLVLGLGLLNKTSVLWLGAGVGAAILLSGQRRRPLPGLVWCLAHREALPWRPIGIVFLTVFAVLLINPHTKSEYMAAADPMLFAAGGVAVERLRPPGRAVAVPALAGLIVVSGAILAPLAMPVLPVETYVRYARALGAAPSTPENLELSDLPQFFADMQGWEELARDVSRTCLTIPEPERATTVALVSNYGEAGALELFARRYELPRVICTHNSYWSWGVGPTPVTTFIRLGGDSKDYLKTYGQISLAGVHTCAHCMPYENNLNIFVVRDRREPIESAWTKVKHFQ